VGAADSCPSDDRILGVGVHISLRRSYHRAKEIYAPMTLATRTILVLTLILAVAGELVGQATATTDTAAAESTTTTATTTVAATDTTATAESGETTTTAQKTVETTEETTSSTPRHFEVRNRFTHLLQEHPYELWMILKLDPSLLSNDAFMSGYPDVRAFVAEHPEILKNPRFYLAEFRNPAQDQSIVGELVETLAVFAGIALTVFALAWLIRTIIEQKRWRQLTARQNEVHNKILDRFSTSDQVIEYIRTPAGSKFLESAPIPLHAEKPARQANSPATRIMWSVQFGVIMAIAGLGMLLLSLRFTGENGQGFFALGAIGLCVGAGFIASAAVSLTLSRRLGMWQGEGAPPEIDDSGTVR
jgi:hypothetical protein